MNLKAKRNLPIVFLMLVTLAFFAIVLGSQPLCSYRVVTTAQQAQ